MRVWFQKKTQFIRRNIELLCPPAADTRSVPPVCQVRSADRGQRHRSVQNGLLGQRRTVSQAGPPGTLPPHAAQTGG